MVAPYYCTTPSVSSTGRHMECRLGPSVVYKATIPSRALMFMDTCVLSVVCACTSSTACDRRQSAQSFVIPSRALVLHCYARCILCCDFALCFLAGLGCTWNVQPCGIHIHRAESITAAASYSCRFRSLHDVSDSNQFWLCRLSVSSLHST